jgi:hypothetical protein
MYKIRIINIDDYDEIKTGGTSHNGSACYAAVADRPPFLLGWLRLPHKNSGAVCQTWSRFLRKRRQRIRRRNALILIWQNVVAP